MGHYGHDGLRDISKNQADKAKRCQNSRYNLITPPVGLNCNRCLSFMLLFEPYFIERHGKRVRAMGIEVSDAIGRRFGYARQRLGDFPPVS